MENKLFGFSVRRPENRIDMVRLAANILGVKCDSFAPYPWCSGNPTVKDCIKLGYCAKDPNCGE